MAKNINFADNQLSKRLIDAHMHQKMNLKNGRMREKEMAGRFRYGRTSEWLQTKSTAAIMYIVRYSLEEKKTDSRIADKFLFKVVGVGAEMLNGECRMSQNGQSLVNK